MFLTSLVFLRTYPRSLLALVHCSSIIDLLIPREGIGDVNTKILLGRDYFKLRACHMIDKADGLSFLVIRCALHLL